MSTTDQSLQADANAVETALDLGWAGFKRHPWLLTIPPLFFVPVLFAVTTVLAVMTGSLDALNAWQDADSPGVSLAARLLIPNLSTSDFHEVSGMGMLRTAPWMRSTA